MLQAFRRHDLLMKKGPKNAADAVVARSEALELFDVAQVDIWASIHSALQLPKEGASSRATLNEKIDKENKRFGKLIKANLEFLLDEDGGQATYDTVTASLAAFEATVKTTFPSKPPQTVADIVTLYEHACAIEARFNEVLMLMINALLYILIYIW